MSRFLKEVLDMEAMAAESLVASAWELDGFLTKLRCPVRTESGQASDIDVIGINAAGIVRLAECKVPWGARHIQVIQDDLPEGWLASAANIERLWNAPPEWFPRQVEELEFWLCANLWFPDEESEKRAHNNVYQYVRPLCPHGLRGKLSIKIKSTRDVLLNVISGVKGRVIVEGQGRRFGQPVLDTVRELVRYSNPIPHGGGQVGAQIRAETRAELLRVLGFDE